MESGKRHLGTVLVIDDDEAYADRVALPFLSDFEVRFAYNVWQGRALIEQADEVRALFVDLNMPGGGPFSVDEPNGAGFELIRAARDQFSLDVPIFVISVHVNPRLVNQAQSLGAEYLAKYAGELGNLTRIAERLRIDARLHDDRVSAYVARIASELELTSRKAEVLSLLLTGMRRVDVAHSLGISPNTVKRHVEGILRRASVETVAELRSRFRAAIWGLH